MRTVFEIPEPCETRNWPKELSWFRGQKHSEHVDHSATPLEHMYIQHASTAASALSSIIFLFVQLHVL